MNVTEELQRVFKEYLEEYGGLYDHWTFLDFVVCNLPPFTNATTKSGIEHLIKVYASKLREHERKLASLKRKERRRHS